MTIAMGLVANLPFGIAAGLGINSFLAVSVVHQVTWAEAMGLVVINGVVIVILALTGIRTMIFTAVPAQLKAAITVGIGLFIAFIGSSTRASCAPRRTRRRRCSSVRTAPSRPCRRSCS